MKFAATLAVLLSLSTPALASDRLVEVAAWYVWLHPRATGTFVAGTPEEPYDLEISSDTGYGASVALFLGRRVSLELAAAQVSSAVRLEARGRTANLLPRQGTFIPATATLQLHFRPQSMVDPYLGLGAMQVFTSTLTGGRDADLSVREIERGPIAYIVNGGFNIELMEQFGLLIDVKWMPSGKPMPAILNDPRGTEGEIVMNPVQVSIGVSYRWGR